MATSFEDLDDEINGAKPPAVGIQKIRYTHDAMIDLIIQNPAVSQNQLAAVFGYTAAWVSTVIASDAFQARLAERREQLIDPTIRATLEERSKALYLRSLEIVQEKLSRPVHQISDGLALKALEMSAKAVGLGARPETLPAPPNSADHIAALAHRLIDLQQNVRGAINVQSQEVHQEGEVRRLPQPGSPSDQSGEGTVRADERSPDPTA